MTADYRRPVYLSWGYDPFGTSSNQWQVIPGLPPPGSRHVRFLTAARLALHQSPFGPCFVPVAPMGFDPSERFPFEEQCTSRCRMPSWRYLSTRCPSRTWKHCNRPDRRSRRHDRNPAAHPTGWTDHRPHQPPLRRGPRDGSGRPSYPCKQRHPPHTGGDNVDDLRGEHRVYPRLPNPTEAGLDT